MLRRLLILIFVTQLFISCGTYFNQPFEVQNARIGELTPKSKALIQLPAPKEPIVVGVYDFSDQTGQYKSVENGSSFSTAVSQGATTMLIKALEDSNWFTPIERENLRNLTTERQIIKATREEYSRLENKPQPKLPPLLFAGILLEGGVVSYDSNIITGGLGARYFGVGGSTQYREDRLTIYLRAVSTSNGKILKTVYVSKTVLSQAIDASLFRYVNFQRLLEVETGITKNEPVQLAMKDAIEKAVEALIIEGIQDKLWTSAGGEETNKQMVDEYLKVKALEESTLLYNRKQLPIEHKNAVGVSGFTTLFQSDFAKKPLNFGTSLSYTRKFTDNIGLTARGSYMKLEAGNSFEEDFIIADLNLEVYLLPYDDFSPMLYAGGGMAFNPDKRFNMSAKIPSQVKTQGGVGVDARLSTHLSLRAFAEVNLFFSDEVDRTILGKRDDFYYAFGIGLNYHFGKRAKKEETTLDIIESTNEIEE